jgi:hypothetical protein
MPPVRKTLTLYCDETVGTVLCTAIREYAVAAYPPGGSECAQVARYTLLELADQVEKGLAGGEGEVEISRRPRAIVKAAITYYFDRDDEVSGRTSASRRELFLGLLRGNPAGEAELEQAGLADGPG